MSRTKPWSKVPERTFTFHSPQVPARQLFGRAQPWASSAASTVIPFGQGISLPDGYSLITGIVAPRSRRHHTYPLLGHDNAEPSRFS